ncbi:ankyrin repeat-containing domain protein [Apodospora peruviana]|uniref:Ankyrin repeat-containing domain protein n=1 Tax=Apodospora peruviana TaxID=516989 RepID=A0AAE0M4J6_9PEZI|nr:ankyrin repeat-containing domain protein [Apodospora peruviana]
MASFRSLPAELVLEIAGWLIDERWNLSALSRTTRFCHSHLRSLLYSHHGRAAVTWAVTKGDLDVLKTAIFHAKENKYILLNTSYVWKPPIGDWNMDRNYPGFESLDVDEVYPGRQCGMPLHVACIIGDNRIVACLLDNGAEMDVPSHRLCRCLYLDDQLGEYYGDDEALDIPKWLPLHHAICYNHPDTALLLLERGAPLYVSSSGPSRGRYSVTALQSAAAKGLVPVVRHLKERYHNLKAQSAEPGSVKSTVDHIFGYDPKSADLYGNTAMHYVSLCYDFEAASSIIRDLQDLGLFVDERGGRRDATPILLACCMGNFSAARAFLPAGADMEAILEEDVTEDNPYVGPYGDSTCLDNALYARFAGITKKHRQEPEWKKERYELIQDLIRNGVDVEEVPGDGDATPLGIAAERGLSDELELLLEVGGASVDGMSESGKTALMAAAQHHRIAAVQILLKAGADVNAMTDFGATAIEFAVVFARSYLWGPFDNTMEVLLKLLLEHGARVGIPTDNLDLGSGPYCGLVLGHGVSQPRLHQYIHLSFLTRTIMTPSEPSEMKDTVIDVLFNNSTEANIPKECWQSTVKEVFGLSTPAEPVDLGVCRKLGRFAARLGYVFDDQTLDSIISSILLTDIPEDIDSLFALGDGERVVTLTGVLTKPALLTVAMMRRWYLGGRNGGRNRERVVGKLLESVKDVKGIVGLLKNKGTLLHLACHGGHVDHVKTLLDRGCDLHAMTTQAITPLGQAVIEGDSSIVQLLLNRGADPYLVNKNPNLLSTLKAGVQNELGVLPGQRLARVVVEMVASLDWFKPDYLDEPSSFEIVGLLYFRLYQDKCAN